MARKPSSDSQPKADPRLLVPTNQAREQLLSRQQIGRGMLEQQKSQVSDIVSLDAAEREFQKWDDYNAELLRRLFDKGEYAQGYSWVGNVGVMVVGGGRDLRREIANHLESFQLKLDYLESLADRLDLIPLSLNVAPTVVKAEPTGSRLATSSSNKVFLVHGQDNETKSIVARFLEHCGLQPVILHEQADQGRTIIEKFEQNADVAFAVILLTPDDLGALTAVASEPGALQPRARQNVILELGYFIGRLGRDRVCALKKGDVELPTDFSGVVYTPYDGGNEGWKIKLARELKAAGLSVDLERALG